MYCIKLQASLYTMQLCKWLLIFISHLFGQVVQALVMLLLRDRAVFEEGFQGGHLPVVEGPALFLRGHGLPLCLVRRVHRATVLPATGIVPCRCACFKSELKDHTDFVQRRSKAGDRRAEKSVKDARKHVKISYKYAQRPYTDFGKLRERSVRDAAYFTERRCIFS